MEKIKKNKILILGCSGLIGHMVYHYFTNSKNYIVYGLSKKNKFNNKTVLIDVEEFNSLEEYIYEIKPDYVVNAIGILISESERNITKAIYLNSLFPHKLNLISKQYNFKLIHISTDCVFSGSKGNYYENDFKDGKSNYAKTKGLGEIINDINLTIRTSVVGPELNKNGEELFNWFMNQNNEINGYLNSFWSGVSTIELSKFIDFAIVNNLHGLYHLTNGIKINKNDLLNIFNNYKSNKNLILPTENSFSDKSFVDNRKIYNSIPSYEHMVKKIFEFINNNQHYYPHYSK